MRLQKIGLTVLLALVATLTTRNFPLISNPKSPFQNSQVLAQTPDERKAEADRLNEQAFDQYLNIQFEAALQSWQQALLIYREINDRRGEELALEGIKMVYETIADRLSKQAIKQYETSEFQASLQSWQQALTIYRDIQNRRSEGLALGGMGLVYESLGDYRKAVDYTQQWLAIAKSIQDQQSEGAALGNLGLTNLNLGNYAKAIEYSQQLLPIAKNIRDRQSEGRALGILGAAYISLGDYAKAVDYLEQQLAIAREIEDRRSEGAALGNLGAAYRQMGNYAQAIEYSQQQLAIAKEIQNRQSEGKALANLGTIYIFLGDYDKAIDYLQQQLAIAQDIQDRRSEGGTLGNLGFAYRHLGDNLKAIEYYQQQLAIAKEIQNRDGEGLALNNLGFAFYKQGDLATAEQTLMDGMKVWESIRADLGSNDVNKVSLFETQASVYQVLQQVFIAQNKTDAALEIAERGRARALVELLARRLSPNPVEQPPITPLNIDQIQQVAKAKNSTLVQYSIIYDEFKIRGRLRVKESELYIWVIKPTGEITFRRSNLKPLWQQHEMTLSELVTNSRESIGVRGRGIVVISREDNASQTKQLQQLHQLLIQPIADLLPTDPNQRVIFIPQQSLFLVPFAALQDESGQYLIEKHTILTAPSIQVLELTRKQQERLEAQPLQTKDALVVGNPFMPSVPPYPGEQPQQLPSLPGAQKEAQAIAPLLNTKALIGKDATKTAVEQLMPNARIIHLATHGLLDDVRGLGSAIALTPSGSDDGLLTAEQILELQLNAELVVLSACDTGRGRITGDGVIGLSRSLISAGVPSVIVSLWSVPDAPTASLMTEFYQNLQNNPDKSQALRQAMLTTMKQHPNPRDWAAFTLIGEAQ